MTILLTDKGAEAPRDWSAEAQKLLGLELRLLRTSPKHPAVGATRAVGDGIELMSAAGPEESRLLYDVSSGGSISLYAVEDGDGILAPPLSHDLLAGYLETQFAVLKPGVDARPAASRREEKSRSAVHIDELSPLAMLPIRQLRALGVPQELVDGVRRVVAPEALLKLGLPAPAVQKLLTLLGAVSVEPATCVPESLRYRVPNVETLERYYRGDLRRLLLNLDPEQERLIDLIGGSPLVVKGIAGSGKTTVALYGISSLLHQTEMFDPPRILFLTYNKSLCQMAQTLVEDLLADSETERASVEVRNIHSWCYRYLSARAAWIQPASSVEHRALIRQAVEEMQAKLGDDVLPLNRGVRFFEEEISQVVKGRCRGDGKAYMEVARTGRGTGLPKKARKVVLSVAEKYQSALAGMNKCDWDDVLLLALARLEKDRAFEPYDHVFVDEAQDLAPVAIALTGKLVDKDNPSLVIVADAAQTIYQSNFTWRELGIEVAGGRSFKLDRNYRGTKEIHKVAWELLGELEVADEEDVVRPKTPGRSGPRPRLVRRSSIESQVEWVVKDISESVRANGMKAGNIAVLAYRHWILVDLEERLSRVGVPATHFASRQPLLLSQPTVKLITIHSSKGLEFPVVYVVGFDDSVFYMSEPEDAEDKRAMDAQQRRLAFVALSRAMHDLTITCTRGDELRFLRPHTAAGRSPGGRQRQGRRKTTEHPKSRLVDRLAALGLSTVDKRPSGGALWVLGGADLEATLAPMRHEGIKFQYKAGGSRATAHEPAWWTSYRE